MAEPQVVASRYALEGGHQMADVLRGSDASAFGQWLAAKSGVDPRWGQLGLFLLAAVLLLGWENLSNDVFDDDTGVDSVGKPHS